MFRENFIGHLLFEHLKKIYMEHLTWNGTGKNGQGEVTIGGESLTFSGPLAMSGKGVGVSPEDLLIAGVTTCYSVTLFSILKRNYLYKMLWLKQREL